MLTKFEPWMPMYFREGSIGGDIERISTRRIRAFYEEELLSVNEFGNSLTQPYLEEEPLRSNGIAIAGTHTRSGKAMLLINPQTPFILGVKFMSSVKKD